MAEERRASSDAVNTPLWIESEKAIMRQMFQAIVPIWVFDLLQTMSQLKTTITNVVDKDRLNQEHSKPMQNPFSSIQISEFTPTALRRAFDRVFSNLRTQEQKFFSLPTWTFLQCWWHWSLFALPADCRVLASISYRIFPDYWLKELQNLHFDFGRGKI